MMDASWTEHAACREPGTDPELFFPVSESGPAARQIAAAKAICARCPVAAECRDWALRAGEPAGIWGGTTPEERRALRRSGHEQARPGEHRRTARRLTVQASAAARPSQVCVDERHRWRSA